MHLDAEVGREDEERFEIFDVPVDAPGLPAAGFDVLEFNRP